MDLVQPGLGLVIWMTLAFLVVLFLLGKFAWKPILTMIREREASIEDALQEAEKAKDAMRKLKTDNEQLLNEARQEREEIVKSAREMKNKIIAEAEAKANEKGDKIIAEAREKINAEKSAAINELKNQVAELSIEIAEKIVKQELSSNDKQKELIQNALESSKLN